MPASATTPTRRRQWGTERSAEPLPRAHARPSDRKLALGRIAIIATVLAWLAYLVTTVLRDALGEQAMGYRYTLELVSYVLVLSFLTFSSLMYLVARQGALEQFRTHHRIPRAELDRHFEGGQQSLTIVVPSYREEPEVVRMTLWSAALQEVAQLRVVLLLDDPPAPTDPVDLARLEASRLLTVEIAATLEAPRARFEAALFRHGLTLEPEATVARADLVQLAEDYEWAADWLDDLAGREAPADHVGDFFATQVLGGTAKDLRAIGFALGAALAAGEAPPPERMLELRRRLVRVFSVDLGVFERKQFASLSHESNKAMNLNAYLGLMGGHFARVDTPDGVVLREVDEEVPNGLSVPRPDYVLTLDADSLLLPEYCLRLVYELEQPGNERVAVIQTPYSAFRGARTRIERLAGATTDLQHVLHQGLSRYSATFWVGANAIIRRSALEEIERTEVVDGVRVHRYVQDRTPIEDTESSVDLIGRGWSLINYPERLSYSATPSDFGSLVVQRRRWANGGLLILPKFWMQTRERRARGERVRVTEVALRVNYMASIAWSTFGLLFLLLYPYDRRLLSPLVILTAVPYALALTSDLRSHGYRRTDALRIYGFNLILLPVNLAGVTKSLEQAVTGRKIPFARTPKVRDRTATPGWYVVAPLLVIGFSTYTLWHEYTLGAWGSAAFAGVNAVLATWAMVAYVGIWASVVDLAGSVGRWLVVQDRTVASAHPEPVAPDWRSILHHGTTETSPTPGHVLRAHQPQTEPSSSPTDTTDTPTGASR